MYKSINFLPFSLLSDTRNFPTTRSSLLSPTLVVIGESGFNFWGFKGPALCVILVLRVSIWNAPGVSLVLPDFDETGSLGSPPHRVVYPPV